MVLFLLFTCGRDRLEIDTAQNEVPTGASFIKNEHSSQRDCPEISQQISRKSAGVSGNKPAIKGALERCGFTMIQQCLLNGVNLVCQCLQS